MTKPITTAIPLLRALLDDIRCLRQERPYLLLQLHEVAAFIEATEAALAVAASIEPAMFTAATAFEGRVRRTLAALCGAQSPGINSRSRMPS